MQALDQGGSMAESAFRLFRFFLQSAIFLAAVATARWGIRAFLLNRGGRSNRWLNTFSATNAIVLVLLLLLQGPADRLLTFLGDGIARLRPEPELGWLSGMLAGLYYAVIASSRFLLAIYFVGQVYGWLINGSVPGRPGWAPAARRWKPIPVFMPAASFNFASSCFVT